MSAAYRCMYVMLDLSVLLWYAVGSAGGCDRGPRQIKNYSTPYSDENSLLSIAQFYQHFV